MRHAAARCASSCRSTGCARAPDTWPSSSSSTTTTTPRVRRRRPRRRRRRRRGAARAPRSRWATSRSARRSATARSSISRRAASHSRRGLAGLKSKVFAMPRASLTHGSQLSVIAARRVTVTSRKRRARVAVFEVLVSAWVENTCDDWEGLVALDAEGYVVWYYNVSNPGPVGQLSSGEIVFIAGGTSLLSQVRNDVMWHITMRRRRMRHIRIGPLSLIQVTGPASACRSLLSQDVAIKVPRAHAHSCPSSRIL